MARLACTWGDLHGCIASTDIRMATDTISILQSNDVTMQCLSTMLNNFPGTQP